MYTYLLSREGERDDDLFGEDLEWTEDVLEPAVDDL